MLEGSAPVQSKSSTECVPRANANDHGRVQSPESSETSPSDRVQCYGHIRPFVVDASGKYMKLDAASKLQLRNRKRKTENPRDLESRDQKSIDQSWAFVLS